jgi:hypothetical protein
LAAAVSPGRLASTADVRAPGVAGSAAAAVSPGRLASTADVRGLVLVRSAVVSVSTSVVDSTATVLSPTVARLVELFEADSFITTHVDLGSIIATSATLRSPITTQVELAGAI